MWYRRDEAQKRYSFFFSSTCLAGAFGGLIAYGCSNFDGAKGLESWRWIFILEGAITAFFALILFFVVSDFPEGAKWLSENERAFLKAKLELDVGKSYHDTKLTLQSVLQVFKEWKVYAAVFGYGFTIVVAYSYAFFSTAIIQAFGYSPIETQLRSIYPWICSFGFSMLMAVIADRIRHRFLLAVFASFVAAAGFIILLVAHENLVARYAACFLAASGAYTGMPLFVCWAAQNFGGHHRRSVGIAAQIGFGNTGGIVATYIFLKKDGPYYKTGTSICLGCMLLSALTFCIYYTGLRIENKRKRQGYYDEKWNQMTEKEKAIAGDLSPEFIYKY